MRTQSEALKLFKENVVVGTVNAPDNYPAWDTGGYASHRADLPSLWAEIKPRVQQDTERVALIDALLHDAIALFDRSERDAGQRLMFQIHPGRSDGQGGGEPHLHRHIAGPGPDLGALLDRRQGHSGTFPECKGRLTCPISRA